MRREHDPEAAAIVGHYEATHRDSVVEEPLPVDLTEDALALEFSRRRQDELRYVHEWGRWLKWDGARWAHERTLRVYDLVRALTRDVGMGIRNERIRARVQAASTVGAIVSLARADRRHARVTEDFDADPWLLNTPKGTVNLRTGEMRRHRRQDAITKVTPVAPSEGGGTAPLWHDCLKIWTRGDLELEGFLCRLAGYFLTGSVVEEKLPIVHGPGGNGKTRFVEALRTCLGSDYVTGVAMETLVVTRGEQHPTDIADLRRKRLAIASETEEGRRLAEAKVKNLTGGDRLRARFMRRDFFEFEPTHKLLIVGNHRPVLRNVDEAMRRRLLLIPFTAEIPPDDRDPHLAAKLRAERPGILRWALDGCLEWQAAGLNPPESVSVATRDFFENADAFGRWAEECLVFDVNASVAKADAFASWKRWAEASGEFVGRRERLRDWLLARPTVDEARLAKGVRAWIGVGLREEG